MAGWMDSGWTRETIFRCVSNTYLHTVIRLDQLLRLSTYILTNPCTLTLVTKSIYIYAFFLSLQFALVYSSLLLPCNVFSLKDSYFSISLESMMLTECKRKYIFAELPCVKR
jgi:hypothetical protein